MHGYIHRASVFLGDADRAIADASKAMTIGPRNGAALAMRANAYRAEGDLRRAIGDYTAAITFGSNDAQTYHERGFAYRMQGDRERAITDFKMAIRLRLADLPESRAELKAPGIEAPEFDPKRPPNVKQVLDWLK